MPTNDFFLCVMTYFKNAPPIVFILCNDFTILTKLGEYSAIFYAEIKLKYKYNDKTYISFMHFQSSLDRNSSVFRKNKYSVLCSIIHLN